MIDNSQDIIADDIRVAHDRVGEKIGEDYYQIQKGQKQLFNEWSLQKQYAILRNIIQKYCDKKNIVALDAGCGTGKWSRELINIGVEKVVGVDFSPGVLKTAQEIAKNEGLEHKISLVKANLENLTFFPDNTFDIVFCYGVIEHLDNPNNVFKEFSRVVKKNGYIIEGVPRKWSLSYITFMLFGQNPRDWGTQKSSKPFSDINDKAKYYRYYTFRNIKHMINNMKNLKIIERWPTLYIWVVGKPHWALEYICKKSKKNAFQFLKIIDGIGKTLIPIPSGDFIIIKKLSD
jgi:ubiquinone/menaquinone biosynthesis C-methylase UbiE